MTQSRRWIVCAVLVAMMIATSVFEVQVAAGSHPSIVLTAPGARTYASKPSRPTGDTTFGSLPLTFEANVGQSDPSVAFLAHASGYTVFLTATGVVAQLNLGSIPHNGGDLRASLLSELSQTGLWDSPAADPVVLRTQFIGANPKVSIEGLEEQAAKSNYFVGNDPTNWRTGVPNFLKVGYAGIYPGIDVVFYGNDRDLEYDFLVSPAGNPHLIQLSLAGADHLSVDEYGDLVLAFPGGEVVDRAPFVYQTFDGLKQFVGGHYRLEGSNRVAFDIGDYDHSRTLIIDPVFSYSTYLGGKADDFPIWSDLGADGSLYLTGFTSSTHFPTTTGAFQQKSGGRIDVFVTKLTPDGSGLVYSTYLGGRGDDFAIGISVTPEGRAHVVGGTSSPDFPIKNAIQPTSAGGFDAFITVLDPTGSSLVYSTYLGGSGDDAAFIGPTHPDGTTWVYGRTGSTDFPVTSGAFQTTFGGGPFDIFVAKIDASGQHLVYSTYVGGSGDDEGTDGTVDGDGHAFVTGFTSSRDFPVTPGAFQRKYGGGDTDAVAVKVSPDGSRLEYSTYLGGNGREDVTDGRLDSDGNLFIPGSTNSTNFPTTPTAFQSAYAGGAHDGFIAILNPSGSSLRWASYFGGTGDDTAGGIRPDGSGGFYFVGATSSTDLPTTRDALQPTHGGGPSDSFVGHFSFASDLRPNLTYSSYFGGAGFDEASGQGVNLDSQGNLFVVGDTNSANLFTTPNAFQRSEAGGFDGFAYKLQFR